MWQHAGTVRQLNRHDTGGRPSAPLPVGWATHMVMGLRHSSASLSACSYLILTLPRVLNLRTLKKFCTPNYVLESPFWGTQGHIDPSNLPRSLMAVVV